MNTGNDFRRAGFLYLLPPILVIAAIDCLKMASTGFRVDAAQITDTDSQMRLAYIRDVILRQGWQAGFWLRDNAPYGAVLHWTKPFYYLVIALYEGFRALLPPDRALVYAGYFTGPLLAVVASVCVYWAVRPLVSPALAMAASLAVVLSNSFFVYDKLGEANHHAALLIEFVVVTGFAIRLAQRPGGVGIAAGAGLAAAFAVWTSFEMVVLAGILFAFVFYLWVRDGKARDLQAVTVATGFSALTTLSVLTDPPYGGLHVLAFDHPSLPVLALAALPVVVALLCGRLPKLCWHARLIVVGLASAVGLGLYVWLFGDLLAPAMQHMDPAVATEMDPTIAEWVPIRRLWSTFALIGNGLAGLAAGALFLPRNRYYLPILGFLAVFAVAAHEHLRFAGYFWVAGTFVAAYCLHRWHAEGRQPAPAGRTLAVATGAFLLVVFCQGFGMALRDRAEPPGRDAVQSCRISTVAAALNDAGWLGVSEGSAPVFFDDFEMTPGLLYWTGARTVAGYYHRDIPGVADLLSFFRDVSPGDRLARGLAEDHGARFVLVCPGHSAVNFSQASVALYLKAVHRAEDFHYGPPTLYDRLSAGNAPAWLTPRAWPAGTKTDLKLYQVNLAAGGRP